MKKYSSILLLLCIFINSQTLFSKELEESIVEVALSSCELHFSGILPDSIYTRTPNLAPKTILISNRDWGPDKTNPLPKNVIDALLKKGMKFILLRRASSKESNAIDALNLNQNAIYIFSDEYSNGYYQNWTRDFGPITVIKKDGSKRLIFPKSFPQENVASLGDETFKRRVSQSTGIPYDTIPIFFQGGHLVSTNQGLLILSKELLNLNPGFTQEEIEDEFRRYTSTDKFYWVERFNGEKTGHPDIFIKDVGDNNILVSDPNDPVNFMLTHQLDIIATDLTELGFNVHRLKNPRPYKSENNRVFNIHYSYANSLLIGNLALVPNYDNYLDDEANSFYKSMGFEVIPIRMSDYIHLFGSVHCATCEIHN